MHTHWVKICDSKSKTAYDAFAINSLNHFLWFFFNVSDNFIFGRIASEKCATDNVIEKSIILSLHFCRNRTSNMHTLTQASSTLIHLHTPNPNVTDEKFVCTEHSQFRIEVLSTSATSYSQFRLKSIQSRHEFRWWIDLVLRTDTKRNEMDFVGFFLLELYELTTQSRQSVLFCSHQVNFQFLTNCITSDVSLYSRMIQNFRVSRSECVHRINSSD